MATATLRCPICKREVPFDSPEMPFCSKRCRLIDLGNWASEKYVVPGSPADTAERDYLSEEPEGSKQ